jgi:hypothetical protein
LSKYINWENDQPTHSLAKLGNIDRELLENLNNLFSSNDGFIILAKNRKATIALWEVGYQLLNILLQAHSLNLPYKAILFDEPLKMTLERLGVKSSVAMLQI